MNPSVDPFVKIKTPKFFGDTELFPYSPSRQVAAQSMGLKYPMIGEEGAASFEKTGTYPGMLVDVIIVLSLCLTPDKAIKGEQPVSGITSVMHAITAPEAALAKAIEWADQEGICTVPSDKFQKAAETFANVASEAFTSEFAVASDKPTEGPEDPNVV